MVAEIPLKTTAGRAMEVGAGLVRIGHHDYCSKAGPVRCVTVEKRSLHAQSRQGPRIVYPRDSDLGTNYLSQE